MADQATAVPKDTDTEAARRPAKANVGGAALDKYTEMWLDRWIDLDSQRMDREFGAASACAVPCCWRSNSRSSWS